MKIYTLTNEYPTQRAGGIGIYIEGLKYMLKEQMDVDVVAEFPRRWELISRMYQHADMQTETWVHHLFPVGMAAFILSVVTGRSYCVFLHGNDFDTAHAHPVRHILARLILQKARKVITNSHALATDVKHVYGVSAITLQPWLPEDARNYFLTHARVSEVGATRVLTVGRFVPRKGFGLLLDAAKELPDMRFIFAGPKNEYATRLVARANEDQITNVEFVFDPTREETLALYRAADLFAMPTKKSEGDREGFGIVYLEAQDAGLPVLASDYPEMREALKDTLYPYMCQPDVPSIVRQLNALRANATPLASELHDFVEKNHTIERRKRVLDDILYA